MTEVTSHGLRTLETQNHIWQYSESYSLSHCSDRKPCRRRICPWCAARHARAVRRELGDLLDPASSALYVVLAVESADSLADAHDAMARARTEFGKRGWLTANSRTWFRQTEVTHGPEGWHVHDNVIVWGDLAQLNRIRTAVGERWEAAAARAGVRATAGAQYAQFARDAAAVIDYVTKGLMVCTTGTRGQTPGDLLAGYMAGDADAAELWAEIENYDRDRRTRYVARGGGFSSQGVAA